MGGVDTLEWPGCVRKDVCLPVGVGIELRDGLGVSVLLGGLEGSTS